MTTHDEARTHALIEESKRNGALFREARDGLLELLAEPQRARDTFRWPELGDHFNWARDVFDPAADGNDVTALRIIEDDGSVADYSFDELRRRSNAVAHHLRGLGISEGDVVMLMLANRVELWVSMLAVMKLGAVMLPTAIVLGPHELVDRVTRAEVRWVITDEADAEKFDAVEGDFGLIAVGGAKGAERVALEFTNTPEDDLNRERLRFLPEASAVDESAYLSPVGGADPAIIYFTSGTTSKPKIVVHSHLSYPAGHLSTMAWIGVKPGDTHMVISSPGWGKHAWSAFFAPWHVGATIVVDNVVRFQASRLLRVLDEQCVNTFCAPPTVWRMLIQECASDRPRGLRELLSAGEPLNPEVIARIREWWGLEIRDGYGQTETTAIIGNLPGDPDQLPGSMGRPLPGVSIVLVDEHTGERIPSDRPRAEGEVCLELRDGRPLNLMVGYAGDPEATADRCRGEVFHTGDVAQRDPEGRYTFVGRTDDIFKSSDYKVSPFEVESVLVEHPYVVEAAVIGAPDETRLNITKAYVQLAEGIEPNEHAAFEILKHARAGLPPYMRVRRIEFQDLPKTSSGKIRRVELRDREQQLARRGERIPNEWREGDFPELKRP